MIDRLTFDILWAYCVRCVRCLRWLRRAAMEKALDAKTENEIQVSRCYKKVQIPSG
jgi:hypothetical protein